MATAHTAADRIGRLVSCVVERSSCRSIMLKQEELAFLKAMSTLQLSYVILRELKLAMSRRNKPAVLVGNRGTTSGLARATQRSSGQLAGNRKANELASSGDSSEPANRHPAPGAVSAPLPASSSHGRTSCCRQPATRVPRGRGDVRGCSGRVHRPASAKRVAQAHRHRFRPV
jgi:hypothetical protein